MEDENNNRLEEIDPDRNHFENDYINSNVYSIESFSIMKPGKFDMYNAFFDSLKIPFDIIIFTETWLTENKKTLCEIDGYVPKHLIRPKGDGIDFKDKGGGISIFIKNGFSFRERNDLTVMHPYMECPMWLIYRTTPSKLPKDLCDRHLGSKMGICEEGRCKGIFLWQITAL